MTLLRWLDTVIAGAGAHLRRHWTVWLLATLLLFLTLPGLDLTISGWFFLPDQGWYLGKAPFAEFIRKGMPTVLFGIVLFIVVLWGAGRIYKQVYFGVTGRIVSYLLASLAVGPGLLANVLFKENWGRARPSQITQFGGDAFYTPPFLVTNQCDSNCSFVSGHGALGFWVTAFAFLLPVAWRSAGLVAALCFGVTVGVVRIVQGGHFFSDVLYSGVLVVTVNWIFARWMLQRQD
ncbi:phosphatase PAP2 family protein [Novispirillum itersonii]|uniref:Lipid A 4'-phosphatase n=1 Tax=Novispirillum itersonii TaxID=189 RepID=A0A7W9ZFE4_NOVIT|nr:phosphatase PAP2 family protein [Novispirillum itersonii]MBB6209622.1 lipid A 4'-phosphatase [Novispirillum itersonii]